MVTEETEEGYAAKLGDSVSFWWAGQPSTPFFLTEKVGIALDLSSRRFLSYSSRICCVAYTADDQGIDRRGVVICARGRRLSGQHTLGQHTFSNG